MFSPQSTAREKNALVHFLFTFEAVAPGMVSSMRPRCCDAVAGQRVRVARGFGRNLRGSILLADAKLGKGGFFVTQ